MLGEPIPKRLREQMDADPFYHQCVRCDVLHDHFCEPDPMTGRLIEWEHAMYYKGRKVNEIWAIIPICWLVHRGGQLNKEINQWIALNRATPEELEKFERSGWDQRLKYLNAKYGVPQLSTFPMPSNGFPI